MDERVDILMRELEDLGAFNRKVLCFCSPTGTGYLNYVMMETLEYLTGGDCATFALQYSLRPSFISLDRVAMGREQNRAMLHALHRGGFGLCPMDSAPKFRPCSGVPRRPTLQARAPCSSWARRHQRIERAGVDEPCSIGTLAAAVGQSLAGQQGEGRSRR